ncbi:hypothetical protein Tco_0586075 [Tanacetum coccineum]
MGCQGCIVFTFWIARLKIRDKENPEEEPADRSLPTDETIISMSPSDDDNDDDDVKKDEEDEEEEEHLASADPSAVPTDDLVPSS